MYKDLDNMLCGTGRVGRDCGAASERARCGSDSCGCERERSADSFCGCNGHSWGLVDYPVAMVYSPLQKFDGVCDKQTALHRGTMFEALDLPFKGASVYKGGNCRG
ncbi:MAG: spore coat associated protein CotJA [Clostridia bacterium]|nr:spore coat associated protein CotJA [Clostridia bacterium]